MSEVKQTGFINTKSLTSIGGLGVLAVILVLLNIIFAQMPFRWDITKEKLYSLSDGSKQILSNLKEDVAIKVFYTRDNPNVPPYIKNYATRMLDFLAEYEYHGDGRISVEVLNPKPDSEIEEWAQKYGIEGRDLPDGEKLYFGMTVLAADLEETMKFIDPTREEHLEYDITRMITKIQSPEKRKIGIISGIPIFGSPPNYSNPAMPSQGTEPWHFITELKKTYEVSEITASAETLEEGLDLLIVHHPKNLSDALQYAVDQYVLRGGTAIVFVDPVSLFDQSPGRDKSSSVDKLFRAWGVKMDKAKVVVDYDYPYRGRGGDPNPLYASLTSDAFDKDNIATGQLEKMLLTAVGALEKLPDSEYTYDSLIKSGANSMLTESFRVQFGPQGIRKEFKATADQYDLAAKITGKFKTAFPGGKPASPDQDTGEPTGGEKPHLTEAEKEATVIVMADADLLADNTYLIRQTIPVLGFNIVSFGNDNLNFLLNFSEMLTGSEELISIRSRGKFERPFDKVEELERKAGERWMAKEQELAAKVDEVNRKLRELEKQKDATQRYILSDEQEKEIKKFKEEKLKVNKELKRVRGNLRAEIEVLGAWIKALNIGLMPLLVSLAGLGYGLYRRKKGNL